MHRKQPHRAFGGHHRRWKTTGAQGPHQRIGIRKASGVHLQSRQQQRAQMRQHPGTAPGWHRLGVAGQHIAFIKNLAQRIVRRQALQECLPARQPGGNRPKNL